MTAPKHPPLTPLDSTMLTGMSHDPTTGALFVKFTNGAVYRVDDVSLERATSLEGAKSPGAYYNSQIKPFHVATKVSG